MLKILLADDEQLEREALKLIIRKNLDASFEIEEAANGRTAIAKAAAFKPDIVLLDIKMPGIDGIEAAWSIRTFDPNVRIVFLTAFSQFDFAQEAIRIGAADFIVKPSSEERVVEVLETLVAGLTRERSEQLRREDAELRLNRFSSYLETEFIYSLAFRGMREEKFSDYLSILDLEFHAGRGGMMRIDFSSYPLRVSGGYQQENLKKRSLSILRTTLGEAGIRLLTNSEFSTPMLLFCSGSVSAELQKPDLLRSLLLQCTEKIRKQLSLAVQIGFGSLFSSPEQAPLSYLEAREAAGKEPSLTAAAPESAAGPSLDSTPETSLYGTSLPASAGPEASERDAPTSALEQALPFEYEIGIEQAVSQGNRELVLSYVDSIVSWCGTARCGFSRKRKLLANLAAVLTYTVMQTGRGKASADLDCDLYESATEEDLLIAFRLTIIGLIDRAAADLPDCSAAVIAARDYIAKNYARDLSLEDIAARTGLSSSYFSRIFKQQLDIHVIEYISRLRVEEAKRLLGETLLSVKEVAAAVGYHDPNYFTRVFSRIARTSPTRYRQKKVQIGRKGAGGSSPVRQKPLS